MWERWHFFSFEDVNRKVLGIVAGAGLAAAVAIAFAIGTLGLLENTYAMSGVFRDGSGIRTGSTVRMAGVEVGRVTGVHPDFEVGQVVITWEVDDEVDLGPQTRAKIALGTLFGNNYIQLTGPVEEPFLASMAEPERRLPLEQTEETLGVVQAFDTATRTIDNLDTDLINDVTGQLADVMGSARDALPGLVDSLETVAVALASREDGLTRLLADSDRLLETLSDRDAELLRLIDAAGRLLDEIEVRRDVLHTLFGDGAATVQGLADLISEHRTTIQQIADDIHVTIEAAGRKLPQLNQGLAYFGPTFQGLGSVTNAGPWVDFVVYSIGPVTTDPGGQLAAETTVRSGGGQQP